jgi:hypothetical protein
VQASNSKHYHWWQAPVASFYNKSFYVDVAQNWKGVGLGYLFIMSVMAAVIGTAPIAISCASGYYNQSLPTFFSQVPQVTFADGHVTIDKPCPYQIKDPTTGTVLAEFRTNESGPPKLSDTGTNPPIIVTHDVLYIDSPSTVGPAGDSKTFAFEDLRKLWDRVSFNGSDVWHWWQMIMVWLPIGGLVLGIPMLFAGHVFQTLLYGLLAQFIFNSKELPITYGTGMRLSAMAITPCMVINSLLILTALAMPVLAPLQSGVSLLSIPIAISLIVVAAGALKHSVQGTSPDTAAATAAESTPAVTPEPKS